MEEAERRAAFLTALTTEHFVLQTAANATFSDAGSRSSLYAVSLSSALVAMGFAAQSETFFLPFVATVIPSLFMLGVFTVVRLVDSSLENMQCLAGIARIRSYYRTLAPAGSGFFAAEDGRWPEAPSAPSLEMGSLVAFLTTTASMVAFVNNVVAGAGVALLVANAVENAPLALALSCGVAAAVLLMAVFYAFQRWRFATFTPALLHQEPTQIEPLT